MYATVHRYNCSATELCLGWLLSYGLISDPGVCVNCSLYYVAVHIHIVQMFGVIGSTVSAFLGSSVLLKCTAIVANHIISSYSPF